VHGAAEYFQLIQKVQYTPIENASTIKALNQRSELNPYTTSEAS
jgi:hypothetical protein